MCLGTAGRVTEIVDAANGVARVDVDGRVQHVSLALLADDGGVEVGDWVLVHLGVAMARTDEHQVAEAARMMADLVQAYDDEIQANSG